jgi:hypothetical protein
VLELAMDGEQDGFGLHGVGGFQALVVETGVGRCSIIAQQPTRNGWPQKEVPSSGCGLGLVSMGWCSFVVIALRVPELCLGEASWIDKRRLTACRKEHAGLAGRLGRDEPSKKFQRESGV